MPKSKTFYIIDGHAQIYRAYFAPFRDLTSPAGEPTKATYVFTQMLLNLVGQRKPDYLAMVIDSGDESVFRKEIYPEYKSNRKAPPDDFAPQEQRILRIVSDCGVPIFAKPGFEADDLIATMARRLCDADYEIFVVSRDKDLRQVLTPCIHMYDVQADEVIDEKALEAKCGFTPAEAVEVQSLIGDSIDNVPGIPGVGEKTAVKLIKKYGRAEEVLKHLDELTPKLRENFEKYADRIPTARRLVTLKDDVEMQFEAEACRFDGLNLPALRTHLESLGFTALLRRLEDSHPGDGNGSTKRAAGTAVAYKPRINKPVQESLFGEEPSEVEKVPPVPSGPPPQTCEGCEYHLIDTEEKFAAFVAELKTQKRFAFDTETDSLGAMSSNLIGMSFSWKHATGYYVPVRGPQGSQHLPLERVLQDIKPILEDESVAKVGHNIKYDMLAMRNVGVVLRGLGTDSMVAASVLDSGRFQYGIDPLALQLFNYKKIATEDLLGKRGRKQLSMDQVPLDQVAVYASEDADIALRLADHYAARLAEIPVLEKLNADIEVPLVEVLTEMEFNGVAIDPGILQEQGRAMGEKLEALRKHILEVAGCDFNVDSTKQLQEVLYTRLKLPVVKRTKTGASTDAEALEKLSDKHECPRLILEYRSLVKLKNTYLDNLPEYVNPRTGRIHPNFHQIGAQTGRLSCSDPNLQNIPIRTDEGRRIRLAFVPGDPRNNVLLTADYSQIELRILAHYTEEPALMRAFEADEDIHKAVAAEVFNVPLDQVNKNQRGQAKTINFGIIYGVSAYGLARRIEGLDVNSAQALIDAYARRFPSIHRFLQKCVMEAQAQGYVETLLGRRRFIPDIQSAVLSQRNAAERMAINSVVQGTAADMIKIAMNNIHRRLKREARPSRMLLQVHDELVFETPASAAEAEAAVIREEMVNAMKLKVPLKVEVGWAKNWQEVK